MNDTELKLVDSIHPRATTIRPHRRQFILGSQPVKVYPDWHTWQLEDSIWLSHCPDLRVGWVTDAEGNRWVLLGLAIESLSDRQMPLNEIARTPTAQVLDLYSSWAGRWVLVGQGQVHMDASGLLGCFYGFLGDQLWVSSSPALLVPILHPHTSPIADPRCLQYEVGISWYTPPRSRFEGMQRLLASQILDLNIHSVQPRPLMPPIDPSRGYEETLDWVQQSLVTTLKRLADVESQLWLGLTAGYDSRLMLALCHYAGIQVQPFTRVAARMSVADRVLPPKLAHACGYKHHFFHGAPRQPERKQLVVDHTAGHISDGDAEPFLKGVRDGISGIFFGGHGFAIASGFASLRRLPATIEEAATTAKQIAQLFQEPSGSTATAGLQAWLEWVLNYPQAHLDWRDRFFIEQRQAGWLSSKEQLYDLNQLERFPILNAARNYALLLGLQERDRLGSLVQVELIQRVAPELLQYPFNPTDLQFGLLQAIASKSSDLPSYVLHKGVGKLRWMWRSMVWRA
ncbi:hypothetical protein [Leptothermofonsia sp. ETS-13]|uniref:hypothetical protein n=1 Tax=Leptothermofonsia sp. ETS-13 TaxID=3035696 RepID=UPI003BA254A5